MDADESFLIVAAHPDDEVIGAGIKLSRMDPRAVSIVHLTDGSPRGFAGNREEYAHTRREELYEALAMVGVGRAQCYELGAVDQEAFLHLQEFTDKLEELIRRLGPSAILTHSYEGGHPDHDSAAFCVHEAVSRASDIQTIVTIEFTSYHSGAEGSIEAGSFLGSKPADEEVLVFTPAERQLKRRMFGAFRSQQQVLEAFPLVEERFRKAPGYDFSRPPHSGRLYYEKMGWADGQGWRAIAKEALILK